MDLNLNDLWNLDSIQRIFHEEISYLLNDKYCNEPEHWSSILKRVGHKYIKWEDELNEMLIRKNI